MGAVDSQNLYAFVGWGPHVGTDPMGLVLNREDLWDPNTFLYKHNGRYYQVSGTKLVWEVDINNHAKHTVVKDADVVRAVQSMANVDLSGNKAGAELAQDVKDRVTEDDVKMMAVGYWGICAAPFAGAGQPLLYASGGIGATSGLVTARLRNATPLETVQATVGGYYASVSAARFAGLFSNRVATSLFLSGATSNAQAQLLTAPPEQLNLFEVAGAGIFSTAALAIAAEGPLAMGIMASAEEALFEVGFEAATEAELKAQEAGYYVEPQWDPVLKQWVDVKVPVPPAEETLDIDDLTIKNLLRGWHDEGHEGTQE
jgi:hypothetical protein